MSGQAGTQLAGRRCRQRRRRPWETCMRLGGATALSSTAVWCRFALRLTSCVFIFLCCFLPVRFLPMAAVRGLKRCGSCRKDLGKVAEALRGLPAGASPRCWACCRCHCLQGPQSGLPSSRRYFRPSARSSQCSIPLHSPAMAPDERPPPLRLVCADELGQLKGEDPGSVMPHACIVQRPLGGARWAAAAPACRSGPDRRRHPARHGSRSGHLVSCVRSG